MKKLISVFLSLVMLLTCTAVFVFAEGEQDIEVFNGTVDVWGSEQTGDAHIGYDLAVVSGDKVAYIVDGSSATGNIVIPSSVVYEGNYYKIVAIVKGAFTGCRGLETITLPNYNAFTIVDLDGSASITNGVFVDCEPQILVKYSKLDIPIDTYAFLTTDTGATYYMYDIDEDITENIFSYIMKIFNYIKTWLLSLFKFNKA